MWLRGQTACLAHNQAQGKVWWDTWAIPRNKRTSKQFKVILSYITSWRPAWLYENVSNNS